MYSEAVEQMIKSSIASSLKAFQIEIESSSSDYVIIDYEVFYDAFSDEDEDEVDGGGTTVNPLKRFKCQHCSKAFTKSIYLKRHVKEVHKSSTRCQF